MTKKRIVGESELLTENIIKAIQEKKGDNITCLNLKNIDAAVTDYFIICDGTSNTQVSAIKDSIEKEVREALGEKPWHIEGTNNAEWILMDYVNVVVHIFQKETRDFFNIEGLWADADIQEIPSIN
ncbi:ribosome silencing factor [bacterium]|nr:ribosome silencing factor [bacterium]